MTGHEFAEELKAWESSLNLSHPHKIGKIHANPEKSKHLETATIDLFGLSVDFVNLRQEEYASSSSMVNSESTGSRIPTIVSFGTPLQDALRRDLTINSLFYNIHTGLVEDLTGKGISDLLESPLIRTPLDPHETFLDDPLRILRCIRFASKLEYPLADNIMPVVRERNIQEALRTKVSRERVGIEMDKIFKCM
jgi:tRNA nucleotidyltransferase (CCA-adding enzyme)